MEITLEKQEQTIAFVHKFTTTRMKLVKQINQNMDMVKEYLDQVGEKINGAPFVAYYTMNSKNLEVAIGYPIVNQIAQTADLSCITIPEARCVVAIHEGSYMRLGSTYKKMTKWIKQNNLEPLYIAYEYYLNSPDKVKTKDLRTKIVLFIK